MNDRQPELKIGTYRLISVTTPIPIPAPDSGPPLRSRITLVLERDDGEANVLKFDRTNFIRELSDFIHIAPTDIQILVIEQGSIRLLLEMPVTAAQELYMIAGDTLQGLTPSAELKPSLRTGQQIKDYELQEQIGIGAFGAVYRAFQPKVMRDVAIKIILPSYASQPEFVQRFEREARLVARLEHMNIVPLYDFWQDDKGAYLVMRWLRGGSLRGKLKQGALELTAIARILDQICSALDFAHQHGIIHRDIKPDNILMDEVGNAYLSDFGIAKDAGGTATISSQGVMDGTPHYMSPEPFRDQPVTALSDIYSMGIVLYELLTGERPIANLPMAEMIYKKLHDALPPLNLRRPDLPESINLVVEKATAKDPNHRYPDAASFATAFRRAIQPDQPPAAAVTSPITTTSVFGKLKAKRYDRADLILEKPRLLIGREVLITQIQQLLDENERVLLQGLGGMGKTSLAATVAAGWIDAGKGSVAWLEAANENADTLFEALGRALGEPEKLVGIVGDERIDALRRILSDRKLLIVLDNIWNERALYELLKGLPPNLPVLLTSRHALPIDGDIIDIEALPPEKALELLNYHARKTYAAGSDASELCRTLGYHPFALEIAGKRIKVNRTMTPTQLIQSIKDAPHELDMPENFADVGRKGIKDLLDASVKELGEPVRAVFIVMGGLFSPAGSIELLVLSTDLGKDQSDKFLSDLEQRGLIDLNAATDDTPAHYRLHDLTYSYARSLFKATFKTRHSVVSAARAFADGHASDLDELEFEQANLLGAAKAALTEGQKQTLIDIMYTLAVKGYMDARGHNLLLLERLDDAINAAKQMEPQPNETIHYLSGKRGNAYAERNDLANALASYQDAVEYAPNPNREAILLSVIGAVCFPESPDTADRYFEDAYQIAKENHDDLALSVILEHRGHQAINRKEQETARRFFAEALEVAERLQNSDRLFYALLNLGARESQLGMLKEALSNHQRAYGIAQESENNLWIGAALQCIGEDYHGLDEREKAQENLTEAIALFKSFGATAMVEEVIEYMQKEGYTIPAQ
ncbi:MAG: protein kinase [Chloroflexota bacterium]